MSTPEQQASSVNESLIRLEAKIDVVLGRHEQRLDDLTRRQGETTSTLREHDSRITANALTTAETRSQVTSTAADVLSLRADARKSIDDVRRDFAADIESVKPKNIPSWVAVGIAAVAIVLSPILATLIK